MYTPFIYRFFTSLKASSPCAQNNGGCSHFCVAKVSGYECVCPTGLAVKQDGKICEGSKLFALLRDAVLIRFLSTIN